MGLKRLAATAVVSIVLGLAGPVAAKDIAVDLELVLAVDVSGSVDPGEAKLQRAGYVGALTDKSVISAIKSGFLGRIAVIYVEWADSHRQQVVVAWRLIDGERNAATFAASLDDAPVMRGRFTSISALIDFVLPTFETNGFQGTRRVIDVSGDGANNSGRLVTLARDAAVRAGVTINGLPIVNDRPQRFGPQVANLDLYYRHCVIGGPGAFHIVAQDFESFAVAIRKKMILEIAGVMPPAPRVLLATDRHFVQAPARVPPPCDIGERQLDKRLRDLIYLDN